MATDPQDGTTEDMMRAAIKDGIRAAARADIRAAAPFTTPGDTWPALGFLVLAALVAGLALPTVDRAPHVFRAVPDHAPPGSEITLEGANLMAGMARPLASLPLRNAIGAPNVPPGAAPITGVTGPTGYVPSDASVFLGTLAKSRPVQVLDWSPTQIIVKIPADAPLGDQQLLVFIATHRVGLVDFTVVDPKDVRYHKENSVALDPDEKAYIEAILAELKNVAQRDKVPELDEFAKKLEQMLAKAEDGELSKEQLLDALAKAEEALQKNAEPDPGRRSRSSSADVGKELAKEQLTKELGEALQKNDLDKAKQELEKLADKLANKELSDKQKDDLQKKLEQVAKQMEKQDKQQQDKQQQQEQKLKDEIRRLEKQQDQAKNEQQRQEMERQLEKKKRELQKLKKNEEQKQQSAQRRAVKRLQKDMEKAAENLQKPQKDPNQNEQRQGAGRAREAGVAEPQGRRARDRQASIRISASRPRRRRCRRRWTTCARRCGAPSRRATRARNDPFNKQGKHQDFISRARGGKGQGQAWKPGQGQQGQGQGQNGGQGQGSGQGGDTWGTGHDDNLTPAIRPSKSGNDKDDDLQGESEQQGRSTPRDHPGRRAEGLRERPLQEGLRRLPAHRRRGDAHREAAV